ncbi:MAG TPA: hypothetical protein VIX15_17780 [Streptosporangiaceae bacterium]
MGETLSLYTPAGTRIATIPTPLGICGVTGDTICTTSRSTLTATFSASPRP